MTTLEEMKQYEARAEAAYEAMYDAAPHSVKDCFEDSCLCLNQAIKIAGSLGLSDEEARLAARSRHIDAVYNSQFRYIGR